MIRQPVRARRRRGAWRCACAALLAATALGAGASGASNDSHERPHSVLLLFSLRSTAPAVATVESAFRETLAKSFETPVEIHVEYLDLPDASTVPYAQRLTDLLREKYAGRPIDVIVAARIEAVTYLLQNRAVLFPGVPIVFTDVSRQALGKGPLPPDMTGAFLTTEGQRTVSAALDLQPDAKRVVLLGGASPSDRAREAICASARRKARSRPRGRLAGRPAPRGAARATGQLARKERGHLHQLSRGHAGPLDDRARHAQSIRPRLEGADLRCLRDVPGARHRRRRPHPVRSARGKSRRIDRPDPAGRDGLGDRTDRETVEPADVRLEGAPALENRRGQASDGQRRPLPRKDPVVRAQMEHRRARRLPRPPDGRDRRAAWRAADPAPGGDDLRAAERRYRTVADFTHDWEYWKRPDDTFAYVSPSCLRTTGHEDVEFYSGRP